MTTETKKKIYNLNLFLLIVVLGIFMYWKKNICIKEYSTPIISETSNVHPNSGLNQVKFEE